MVQYLCLLATALLYVASASADLSKRDCAGSKNNCTASSQQAQASTFCSSFVGSTPATSFIYPNIQTRAPKCYRHAPQPPNPTIQTLPSQLQPPPAPTITTAPTPPACFGNATAASQVLSQCSCLGVARSTTTATYTPAITMLGPINLNFIDSPRVLNAFPAYDASYQGNDYIQIYPPGISRNNATSFWVDQFGRLFDTNPPTIPFSLATSSLGTPGGSYVEKVLYSAAYERYVPVLCQAGLGDFEYGLYRRACSLHCKPFGDPYPNPRKGDDLNYICSPNGDTEWWFLGRASPGRTPMDDCIGASLVAFAVDKPPQS